MIRVANILYGGGKDKILFLQPGFSLNMRQAGILGVGYESLDLNIQDCSLSESVEISNNSLADRVESLVSKGDIAAVMWSSPNNPSWMTLDNSVYSSLADVADKNDVLLIHDGAYAPMDFRRDYSHGKDKIDSPLKFSKNSVLLYSASKMLSYAGERVGMMVLHPELLNRKCMSSGNTVSFELIQNGLYSIVAGVSHSAQYGMAAALDAASKGTLDIQEYCRPYEKRGRRMKEMFIGAGFSMVYENSNNVLPGGFYFAATKDGMNTSEQLINLLKCGISAVPLNIFGTDKEGLRICSSLFDSEEKFKVLGTRLKHFSEKFQ